LKAEGKLMFDQVPLEEEFDVFFVTRSSGILRHVVPVYGYFLLILVLIGFRICWKERHKATIAGAFHEYFIDVRNICK
jgi:hypothetical protein